MATGAHPRSGRRLIAQQTLEGYACILPWLVGFLCFVAGPMLAAFAISFTDWSMLSAPEFIGLDNYKRLLNDPLFYTVLFNTAFISFLSVPLHLVVALLIALVGQGWNVLGGYGGQYSFGHAAFFGTGAYVDAVLQVRYGVNAWVGLAIGIAAGAGVEAKIAPNLTAKVEYLYVDLNNSNFVITGANNGYRFGLIRAGVNYHF
jgi:opacity protein-like surface antigen